MTAILALLGSRWGFAAIGAVALVLMYAAWGIQVGGLRGTLSAEQQRTRDAEKLYGDYKLEVERQISDERAARLREVTEALQQRDMMQEEADRLRGVAQAAERRRVQVSNQLLEALRNAPQIDTTPLGPSARAYLDGVRAQQAAAARSDTPPP